MSINNKLHERSIFNLLKLPLSSKWQDVKKSYEIQIKNYNTELSSLQDSGAKTLLEKKIKQLETAFHTFSKRIGDENGRMFETKEVLRSIGLPESSDWDKVSRRFEELRNSNPENEETYRAQLATVERNKDLLTCQSSLGKKTLLTTAAVLGAAGVSLAAYLHLSPTEIEDVLVDIENEGMDGVGLARDTSVIDSADMERFISDNTSAEDEMLSLLGMLPPPELTLALQYKLQVLSALVKTV